MLTHCEPERWLGCSCQEAGDCQKQNPDSRQQLRSRILTHAHMVRSRTRPTSRNRTHTHMVRSRTHPGSRIPTHMHMVRSRTWPRTRVWTHTHKVTAEQDLCRLNRRSLTTVSDASVPGENGEAVASSVQFPAPLNSWPRVS